MRRGEGRGGEGDLKNQEEFPEDENLVKLRIRVKANQFIGNAENQMLEFQ